MTTERFQSIKDKIETVKKNKARAEGAKEKIEQQWKKEYGLDGVDAVQEEIQRLKESTAKDTIKLTNLQEQLEKVADWDEVG